VGESSFGPIERESLPLTTYRLFLGRCWGTYIPVRSPSKWGFHPRHHLRSSHCLPRDKLLFCLSHEAHLFFAIDRRLITSCACRCLNLERPFLMPGFPLNSLCKRVRFIGNPLQDAPYLLSELRKWG